MKNYKKSMRKGFSLEEYVASKLRDCGDKKAKPTKNSGASGSIGDIQSEHFWVECKQSLKRENIILERKVWEKHISNLPINTMKIPIAVIENKYKEKFVILEANDFFFLYDKIYEKKRIK